MIHGVRSRDLVEYNTRGVLHPLLTCFVDS